MSEKTTHIMVSGRVQGVGYRAFALRRAQELGVNGWVRNCPDGSVELATQGNQEQISTLIEALKIGPPASRVEHLATSLITTAERFPDFTIR